MSASRYSRDEVERAVIGAALVDNDAALQALEILPTSAMFHSPKNRTVWDAVRQVADRGDPVELISVTMALMEGTAIESAGGAASVSSYVDSMPDVANVGYYAESVKAEHIRARLISASTELGLQLQIGKPVDNELAKFEEVVSGLLAGQGAVGLEHLAPILDATLEDILAASDSDEVVGIPVPLFGGKLLPMTPGDVYIYAGCPSTGKSSMVDQIALDVAKRGTTVAIFALEMSRKQRARRFICSQTGIPVRAMATGQLEQKDYAILSNEVDVLSGAPIYLDDSRGLTPFEVRLRCRRLMKDQPLGLVVIDYLHLMRPSSRQPSREREVGEMSQSVIEMAGELHVPVILVSQLSRDSAKTGRPPILSDLRDSGQLEQDGHTIVMLDRSLEESTTTSYIRKQRDAEVDSVIHHFDGPSMTFQLMDGWS